MAPKHEDEDIAHRVRVDAEFESELHMYLTGDASHDLMTAVLEERMQRKARQRAVAFGLIWKRSRMSWLQWDGVVDLMSESLNQMLGVGGDLCVVPRARQLSALICLHAPGVFTTSLEKERNVANVELAVVSFVVVSPSKVETATRNRHMFHMLVMAVSGFSVLRKAPPCARRDGGRSSRVLRALFRLLCFFLPCSYNTKIKPSPGCE